MLDDVNQDHPMDLQTANAMEFSDSFFRRLDPRVVRLWRLTYLVGYGVLLVALLASLIVISRLGTISFWFLMAVWFALALGCVWISWWRPPRAYRSWGYRMNDKVLEIRSGLLIERTRLLPLSRVQHVDIERGPFERRFGLASLVLHTAGTHSSSITIPGLDADEARKLRDHLVEIGGDDAV
jgi:uncharacterized protein